MIWDRGTNHKVRNGTAPIVCHHNTSGDLQISTGCSMKRVVDVETAVSRRSRQIRDSSMVSCGAYDQRMAKPAATMDRRIKRKVQPSETLSCAPTGGTFNGV